ncbi:uncharacterized protein K460DRAFT_356074 [Cucurbitaria berberidis CBS 394.84]|uniref:Uncharacterized protein n=1 Tax=Cucurbitaria berberidis CBS 394.84 TaxID=1168544 RepID=A0A9P4GIU2_9PLEO|nr:uncharacterized protein K460DRAFT_356074 [Cucurbitaria berberidis CBS 394.84]KAF1846390.1 hypothetical protein K460DRAFT_356074 [Cucurbitaria berberidis CBS 394.84]
MQWSLESDGWAHSPNDESTNGLHDEPVKVYQKPGANDNFLQISLHACPVSVLLLLLYEAPSTATLSFITWNKAYSLFPRTTFVRKECYLLQKIEDGEAGDSIRAHLTELSKNGIKTKAHHWDDEQEHEITRIRRVGDKHTWVINLETTGLEIVMSPVPDAAIEASTFKNPGVARIQL